MDALKTIANGSLKENAPQFGIGDTVRVDVKIREGDRERIQAFEGTVIAKRGQRRGRNLYRAPRLLWRGCGESLPAALPQCGGREGGSLRQSTPQQAVLPARRVGKSAKVKRRLK